jgi:hypothetical protein
MDASGWLTLQRYIALHLGVSEATISKRFFRGRRWHPHPYKINTLLPLIEFFDPLASRYSKAVPKNIGLRFSAI